LVWGSFCGLLADGSFWCAFGSTGLGSLGSGVGLRISLIAVAVGPGNGAPCPGSGVGAEIFGPSSPSFRDGEGVMCGSAGGGGDAISAP
jgi:hypothetical protein